MKSILLILVLAVACLCFAAPASLQACDVAFGAQAVVVQQAAPVVVQSYGACHTGVAVQSFGVQAYAAPVVVPFAVHAHAAVVQQRVVVQRQAVVQRVAPVRVRSFSFSRQVVR